MYSASKIAHAFVKRGIDEANPLTQMKLQKMVYFAHGVHLAEYEEPLIEEHFQAWKFGPVVPEIYGTYKLYGNSLIQDTLWVPNYIKNSDEELCESAKDAFNYTWEVAKDLSAIQLSNWTHKEGSPWEQVYSADENRVIPDNMIQNYFKAFLKQK